MQILFHVNGYRCRGTWVGNDRGVGSGSNKDLFVAGVRKTNRAKLVVQPTRHAVSGDVYCATVPTGAIVVRSQGRVHITGNSHFDALILNHHYDIRPKLIIDTLGMARAVHGANARLSLAKLAEHYSLTAKGDEVTNARNMHYDDFSPEALMRYGGYCCNDCDITYKLAKILMPHFTKEELKLNDNVIRMFTEPKLQLDVAMLQTYANDLKRDKLTLLLRAGVQVADVMSNDKFAQALIALGIEPPTKISPTTGKEAWAFAKTDPGIQALEEHPDEAVQVLVAARLKNKSTLAETRAERLISMASRGDACVYLKYSGASGTHRLSGGDKLNWQNMTRGSVLRNAVKAKSGQRIVVGDSSTIEARLLDWLAGQEDMVEVYRKADAKTGPDMYCTVAERIYQRPITKAADPDARQVGKTAKLALGYGQGANSFGIVARRAKDTSGVPLKIDSAFAQNIVDIYRGMHPHVKMLWKRCGDTLGYISKGIIGKDVDQRGIVKTCKDGVVLPSGLKMLYPDLQFAKHTDGQFGGEWSFWNGRARERIYGAKVCENLTQALARIIVLEQCRLTAVQLRDIAVWVHSVHDEGVYVCDAFYAPYVLETLLHNMRVPLSWCEDLPLNSEGGFHQCYGKAK